MMDARKLDHILRAAGDVTGLRRFVLVGSAAIFAWRSSVPLDMAMTREADLFAPDLDPEAAERVADELDATLGQASPFDNAYGYHCDGVGPETAILPAGWRTRAKVYASPATNGVSAITPHPADIGVSKLCAGREKDMAWLASAFIHGVIDPAMLADLIDEVRPDRILGGAIMLRERLAALPRGRDTIEPEDHHESSPGEGLVT